jgi:hypothetical protein
MLTTVELAAKLGISTSRVRQLAIAGRITRATKTARDWTFRNDSHIIEAPRTQRLRRHKEKAR